MGLEDFKVTGKPRRLIDLEKQPCLCEPCAYCNGTGTLWRDYMGMEEPEPCDMCDGGIENVCDRCQELDEYEDSFL